MGLTLIIAKDLQWKRLLWDDSGPEPQSNIKKFCPGSGYIDFSKDLKWLSLRYSVSTMRQAPKWTEFPKYPVTVGTGLLAIGVTVAWWAKMDISPLLEDAMIRRGELWRLVTSIFPHVNVLHLIFNLYWLWVFGTLVEQVYGQFKTAALIFLFAVGPNALEYAFSSGGVGLSGVGYGLFGLLWILSKRDERFRDAVDQRTIQLFVIWFFFCIFATATNFMRVGNVAHGAGGVLGMLTGFALTIPKRRVAITVGIGLILGVSLWAATAGRAKVNFSAYASYDECKHGYDAEQPQRRSAQVAANGSQLPRKSCKLRDRSWLYLSKHGQKHAGIRRVPQGRG
jgi:membrane associated rhomboid family serine protease